MAAVHTGMTQDKNDVEILKLMILACLSVNFHTAQQCIWRPDIIKNNVQWREMLELNRGLCRYVEETKTCFGSSGKKLHVNSSNLTIREIQFFPLCALSYGKGNQ